MLIDFSGPILIGALLVWLLMLIVLKKKFKKTPIYLFFFSIFYAYICSVISYTQFPIIIDDTIRDSMGQTIWDQGNLIPFNHFELETSLLNVLLTIPFGFGLSFVKKTNFKKVIFSGLLIGICIEGLQLATFSFIGYTFRVLDINDIIFNFCGVIIGYILFKIFIQTFKLLIHKFDINLNVFLKYIYEIK